VPKTTFSKQRLTPRQYSLSRLPEQRYFEEMKSPSRPLIFISHISRDAEIANLIEETVNAALPGGVDVFNSSGLALVVATPGSVGSPWVNFESGGAWVSGKRVIPCCSKGMEKSSLPPQISHLHAVDLSDAGELERLVGMLADEVRLAPASLDYSELASRFAKLSSVDSPSSNEEAFADWVEMAVKQPVSYRNEARRGVFTVSNPGSVTRSESDQFYGSGIKAGESIRCWAAIPGMKSTIFDCFANDETADAISRMKVAKKVEADFKCLGQLKEFQTIWTGFGDEDRGVEYSAAFLIERVRVLDEGE
jgi:hypothetical protein